MKDDNLVPSELIVRESKESRERTEAQLKEEKDSKKTDASIAELLRKADTGNDRQSSKKDSD